MQPFITKALIHVRWKLNQLIDGGKPKPAGMDDDVWEALKEARATGASQEKSAHMSAISKGKASSTAQHKAVEREVISRLVSMYKLTSTYLPMSTPLLSHMLRCSWKCEK